MTEAEQDLARWQAEAERQKATHIIIVCDTFSHEDYPVYVLKGENVDEIVSARNGRNMQSVRQVIEVAKKKRA